MPSSLYSAPHSDEIEEPQFPAEEHKLEDDEAALTKTKSLETQVSLPREILVVLLISLVQFTMQAGLGSVLAITHIIGDHYGITDPGILSWLTAGYSLTVGTFILFSGRLGDIFGWKRMMILGYIWFAIWSIVLGLSWYSNHVLFIFARVLQGIGPSICLPNGLALLGALYEPGRRKNLAFSVFGGCAPGGSITGYLFAGLFALTWWPCEWSSSAIVRESRADSILNRGILVLWHRPRRDCACRCLCGKPLYETCPNWSTDLLHTLHL